MLFEIRIYQKDNLDIQTKIKPYPEEGDIQIKIDEMLKDPTKILPGYSKSIEIGQVRLLYFIESLEIKIFIITSKVDPSVQDIFMNEYRKVKPSFDAKIPLHQINISTIITGIQNRLNHLVKMDKLESKSPNSGTSNEIKEVLPTFQPKITPPPIKAMNPPSMIKQGISLKEEISPQTTQKETISLFFSYSNIDRDPFQIAEIAKKLRTFPQIDNVYDWQEASENSFIDYMNESLKKSDLLVLFCSEHSLKSEPVKSEWMAAQARLMPIIPIFMNKDHIPFLLASHRGLQYNGENIARFIEELHNLILKKVSHHKAFKPDKQTAVSDRALLEKLKDVINISYRVKLQHIAKFLGLTEEALFTKLVQWGKFLPIKLDEDVIVIEDKAIFLNILEEYLSWIEGDLATEKILTQSNTQTLKPKITESLAVSSGTGGGSGVVPWIFKIIVAGAGGVGKTTLIQRYVTGAFLEDHKMTIGAQFSVKDITLDNGERTRLQLWDFAGEERFRFLLGDYCKGASGAFIIYDITDYATFEQIPEWLKIIRSNAGMIPIFLVGNKYDMENHEIELEQAEKYATESKCILNVFCSAKLNLNVEPMFSSMAKWLIYYAKLDEQE